MTTLHHNHFSGISVRFGGTDGSLAPGNLLFQPEDGSPAIARFPRRYRHGVERAKKVSLSPDLTRTHWMAIVPGPCHASLLRGRAMQIVYGRMAHLHQAHLRTPSRRILQMARRIVGIS